MEQTNVVITTILKRMKSINRGEVQIPNQMLSNMNNYLD